MAKEKLSPRQKMINLMYLVFICMLAMQIDQEIIRSYFDTNSSLQESRQLTENKNDKIFELTLKAKSETNEAAAQNYEIYQGLKGKINTLVESIEGIKTQLKNLLVEYSVPFKELKLSSTPDFSSYPASFFN